ncbi:MAG: proton-conducting transporter membrane subunit [Endomicrobiaceae bacterium]
MNILLNIFIIIPLFAGVILYFIPSKYNISRIFLFLAAVSVNCFFSVFFYGREILFNSHALFRLDLYFRYYGLSSFMIIVLGAAALLAAVYAAASMKKEKNTFIFYAFMLLGLSFANGVLLTDNFIVLILFWEALMIPMFGMISAGTNQPVWTAIKTLIISSVADLCLMFGVMLICTVGGSFVISQTNVDISQPGAVFAFIMMFIGAASKAGAMPFHSWIPDASVKAPLPFMVFIVTAVEKVLSIYLLIRIVKDLFVIEIGSNISIYAMIFGVITLLVANMLAVYQKDFKKMLSYASIGQAGYMIVAVSSVTVFGMVAALFHMTAHIVYKTCLFFVAGNIEKAEGSVEITSVKSNLRQTMPYTFLSFILSAAAFAGVPFFFAFFSKEMIYASAVSVSWIFYVCLSIGSFLSAVAILNWGIKLFYSKPKDKIVQEKEVPVFMFIPTIIPALACLLLGIFNKVPHAVISNIIGRSSDEHSVLITVILTSVSVLLLALAVVNNLYTCKKRKDGLGFAAAILDRIGINKINENIKFDPYEIFIKFIKKFSNVMFNMDKWLNYFYDVIVPGSVNFVSESVKKAHNGNISIYLLWVILGIILAFIIF